MVVDSRGSDVLSASDLALEDPVRVRDAAHRPALPISGGYGHPLHALAVTVPIGSFVAALAFDIASKLGEGRAFGRPATWLVAIGVVSGIVAAILGALDFLRLVKGTRARQVATTHMLVMDAVLVLFVISFFLRRADDTHYLGGTPVAAFVLSAVGVALMLVGAWLGSTLTYSFGVRVADDEDQLNAYQPVQSDQSDGVDG